jgi:hypothetical protein
LTTRGPAMQPGSGHGAADKGYTLWYTGADRIARYDGAKPGYIPIIPAP